MQSIIKDIKLFLQDKNYRGFTIFFLIPLICEIIIFSIFPEPTPLHITISLFAARTGISIIMLYFTFKGNEIATVITLILGLLSLKFILAYIVIFLGIFLNI